MRSIKKAVHSKLAADAQLVTLLGGAKVYFRRPPDNATFPRITYFIPQHLKGLGEVAHDPTADQLLQVDIWSQSGDANDPISARVISLMTEEPLLVEGRRVDHVSMVSEHELYEDDQKIHHDVLRFRIISVPVV